MLKDISIPLTINDVKKNKALCKKKHGLQMHNAHEDQKISKENYGVLSSPKKMNAGIIFTT